jgi:hypothetical protein
VSLILLSCLPYILFSVGMCIFVNWILLMLRINKAFSQSNLRLFTASSFGPTISNVIRPTRRYSELEVVGRR